MCRAAAAGSPARGQLESKLRPQVPEDVAGSLCQQTHEGPSALSVLEDAKNNTAVKFYSLNNFWLGILLLAAKNFLFATILAQTQGDVNC